MIIDGHDVRAEIEEAADAADDCVQGPDVGEQDGDGEALVARQMRHFDAADCAIDLDGARVGVCFDHFHAGNCAGLQEAEHRIPVVGRTIAQTQIHAGLFRGRAGGGCLAA